MTVDPVRLTVGPRRRQLGTCLAQVTRKDRHVMQMGAALLDLDLAEGISDITGLEQYIRAFVVLRFDGIPFGHLWLRVRNGTVWAEDLRRQVMTTLLPQFSRRWTEATLVRPPASSPTELATIAICTRDRPDDLARALAALRAPTVARHRLLVVDNCPSTGRTREICAHHAGVDYVLEEVPGLNAARNRALRTAQTSIVAFTDDDAVPEPGWIDALLRSFDHRLVLAATGLTLPLELRTDAQVWFERYSPFGRGYFRRVFDPSETSPHSAGAAGAGVNMAVRRDVLTLVGPFDESLDAGTPTRSGGDHEMFSRILARGYRIVYEPAAVSRHRHRTTWPEVRSTIEGYGTGVYAAWTGRLVREADLGVAREAVRWLLNQQLPALARALVRNPDSVPLDLVLAELRGCLYGPIAWLRSRRPQVAHAR